jgi:hypothetical protein
MKLDIRPMDLLKDFVVIVTVIGIVAGVAYQAGWIVNRANAGEMIAQSVYQEALDRERADLRFQIEMTSSKMQTLAEKPDRNQYDDLVLQGYVDDLKRLHARLGVIEAPEEPVQ